MKQLNDDASQSNDPIEEGRVRLKDLLNAGIKNSDISNASNSATSSSEMMQNTMQAAKVAEENTRVQTSQTEPSPVPNVPSQSNGSLNGAASNGHDKEGIAANESVPAEQTQQQIQAEPQPQVEQPVTEKGSVEPEPQTNTDVASGGDYPDIAVSSPAQEGPEAQSQQEQGRHRFLNP